MKIYDVSVLLSDKLPTWPSDPPLKMSLACSIARGDPANVTHLDMGAHTGTHLDAPFHFDNNGTGIEQLSLETLMGPCRVFDLTNVTGNITAAALEKCDWSGVTRALFKTKNSRHWANGDHEFDKEFTALAADSAAHLIEKGVELVGVDYLSVEAFGSQKHPVHEILLGMGVVIIESLNLSEVPAGDYELIALPVKLKGADGAPARVVLRTLT